MSDFKTIRKEKKPHLSLQMALLHLRWKQMRQFELTSPPSPQGSKAIHYMEIEKKVFSAA